MAASPWLQTIDSFCHDDFFALFFSPGNKESDTGLAPPGQWDLVSDKQMMQEEQPLQVARCTKIIPGDGTAAAPPPAAAMPGMPPAQPQDDNKYVINVKQIAKFVVGLGDKVAPTDVEEGMRVGYVFSSPGSLDPRAARVAHASLVFPLHSVDRTKYQIQIPLPPKIDPSVTMMTVEDKPDITYADVGGNLKQIEELREVVEIPLLNVRLPLSSFFICTFTLSSARSFCCNCECNI